MPDTVQHKIFEGCKFCRFRCFTSKRKNSNHENEQTTSHVAINYACNQNLIKFAKFIAHEIFALYMVCCYCLCMSYMYVLCALSSCYIFFWDKIRATFSSIGCLPQPHIVNPGKP